RARLHAWSLSLVILFFAFPSFGLAGTQVTGTAAKLQLELDNTTVEDALAELTAAFGLKCRCAVPLERRVSGLYTGNINQVLSRLLDGYNFVVKTSPSGEIELIVLGQSSPSPMYRAHDVPPSLGYTGSSPAIDPVVVSIERAKRQQRSKDGQ